MAVGILGNPHVLVQCTAGFDFGSFPKGSTHSERRAMTALPVAMRESVLSIILLFT